MFWSNCQVFTLLLLYNYSHCWVITKLLADTTTLFIIVYCIINFYIFQKSSLNLIERWFFNNVLLLYSPLRPELLQTASHNRCPAIHHTYPTYLPPPPPLQESIHHHISSGTSCCDRHISASTHRHHHIHRQHTSSDPHAHSTPHYAQAFSPPPLVHASWEPTRETASGHVSCFLLNLLIM